MHFRTCTRLWMHHPIKTLANTDKGVLIQCTFSVEKQNKTKQGTGRLKYLFKAKQLSCIVLVLGNLNAGWAL